MIRAPLLVEMRYGIKHIIFAGDTIAGDQIGLSTHPVSFVSGLEDPFDVVVNLSRGVLKAYGQWFDTIDLITGNHDERPAKATQGQIQLHQFFKDLPVEFSPYSYMYLRFPSTGEYTYICHQYNYSKQSVSLAQQIWAVESAPDGSKDKMHIVIGHTHVEQSGWSPDNNYRCIGLGCMRLTCSLGIRPASFWGRLFGHQTAFLEPLRHKTCPRSWSPIRHGQIPTMLPSSHLSAQFRVAATLLDWVVQTDRSHSKKGRLNVGPTFRS